METLSLLFGSTARVKLMRHFLMNTDTKFTIDDLSRRSKVAPKFVRKELVLFKKASLIKEVKIKITGSRGGVKIIPAYILDASCVYTHKLAALLIEPKTLARTDIVKKIKLAGRIEALIISGALIGQNDSRVDLLIVGKKIDTKKLEKSIKDIESIVGRELVYALFETSDFIYRMNMYDKLIADVLDFPHERLVDNVKLSTRKTFN